MHGGCHLRTEASEQQQDTDEVGVLTWKERQPFLTKVGGEPPADQEQPMDDAWAVLLYLTRGTCGPRERQQRQQLEGCSHHPDGRCRSFAVCVCVCVCLPKSVLMCVHPGAYFWSTLLTVHFSPSFFLFPCFGLSLSIFLSDLSVSLSLPAIPPSASSCIGVSGRCGTRMVPSGSVLGVCVCLGASMHA